MKILLLYGTTEGQTRKVSEFVANKLRSYGDVVTMLDATALPASVAARVAPDNEENKHEPACQL